MGSNWSIAKCFILFIICVDCRVQRGTQIETNNKQHQKCVSCLVAWWWHLQQVLMSMVGMNVSRYQGMDCMKAGLVSSMRWWHAPIDASQVFPPKCGLISCPVCRTAALLITSLTPLSPLWGNTGRQGGILSHGAAGADIVIFVKFRGDGPY